jgi:hypothetical protein
LATGEIDMPRLAEFLKKNILIEANEISPAYVPVVVQQVGAAWRKVKVVDVPSK